MANLVLVDDHVLLRRGLASLVKNLGHGVIFEADNGRLFTEMLDPTMLPQVVLMDINMPEMDGYQTAVWVRANYPSIRVLALSMYDDEKSIIRMLRSGAAGYILKDADPSELQQAIDAVVRKGFYYSELVTGKLMHAINNIDDSEELVSLVKLSDKEVNFLKHICSELSYKEIAGLMFVSPRTIDGYRDALFEKLNVKTRIGLAMYAIRNGIVSVR